MPIARPSPLWSSATRRQFTVTCSARCATRTRRRSCFRNLLCGLCAATFVAPTPAGDEMAFRLVGLLAARAKKSAVRFQHEPPNIPLPEKLDQIAHEEKLARDFAELRADMLERALR